MCPMIPRGPLFLCLQSRNSCALLRRNYLPTRASSCYTVTMKTAFPAAAAQRESGLTTYCATAGGGPHGDSTDKETWKVTASEQKRLKTAKNHQKKSFHVLWDHQVVSSSPSIQAKTPSKSLILTEFLYFKVHDLKCTLCGQTGCE